MVTPTGSGLPEVRGARPDKGSRMGSRLPVFNLRMACHPGL